MRLLLRSFFCLDIYNHSFYMSSSARMNSSSLQIFLGLIFCAMLSAFRADIVIRTLQTYNFKPVLFGDEQKNVSKKSDNSSQLVTKHE